MRAKTAGFTLIEALVALVLLALLALLVRELLATGADIEARRAARATATEEELRVERLFRERLARAVPWRIRTADGSRPAFGGDGRQVRFLVIDDPRLRAQVLGAFELALAEVPGGSRLVLREAVAGPPEDPFAGLAGAPPVTLAELPGTWRFAYFGAPEDGDPEWREEWYAPRPPLAVRLAPEGPPELPFLARLLYAPACRGERDGPPCRPGEVP